MSKNYPLYLQIWDLVRFEYWRRLRQWQTRNDPKPYIGEERCIHEDHHATIVEIIDGDMVKFDTGEVQDWYHCTDPADHEYECPATANSAADGPPYTEEEYKELAENYLKTGGRIPSDEERAATENASE